MTISDTAKTAVMSNTYKEAYTLWRSVFCSFSSEELKAHPGECRKNGADIVQGNINSFPLEDLRQV
jgi:hypothetical protein